MMTIFPEEAPLGTLTTSCVAELDTGIAAMPPKEAVEPIKLPELALIITSVPSEPDAGNTEAIVGGVQVEVTLPNKAKSSILNVPVPLAPDNDKTTVIVPVTVIIPNAQAAIVPESEA